jgi:hypothetical protein
LGIADARPEARGGGAMRHVAPLDEDEQKTLNLRIWKPAR